MRLNISLLHEADFPRMMLRLERGAAGLFRVDACDFRRTTEEFKRAPDAKNVTVGCRLKWLTVDKREEET